MKHFSELQNHYQKWLQTLGFSESSVYSYPKMVYFFLDYIENRGISHITGLKYSHVTDYFTHLQNRKSMRKDGALSAAHLNKSFDAIDKFLEFLNQMGSPNAPTPTNYRILETKNEMMQKVKVLTKSEIQTIYESVPKIFTRMKNIVEAEARRAVATLVLDLCYGCGLRKKEALNLLMNDIDLDKKILLVRQAKGYKDRYVPISENISERIKLFMYQHRKFFNCEHQRLFPFKSESLHEYNLKLRRVSGLNKDFGLHTLRHSIATHLLQNGMSVEQIAKFLGHATLDSTQIYTHLANHDE